MVLIRILLQYLVNRLLMLLKISVMVGRSELKCILSLNIAMKMKEGVFFSKSTIGCINQYCCLSVKVGNRGESARSCTDHKHEILRALGSLKFPALA